MQKALDVRLAVFGALLLSLHVGSSCPEPPPRIIIDNPRHGIFTQASQVLVSGRVENASEETAQLFINGGAETISIGQNQRWSTYVRLEREHIFNPILAEVVQRGSGQRDRDRVVVIAGDFLREGELAPRSLDLRINDSGLDALEPRAGSLVDLDLAALIPPGTIIRRNVCVLDLPLIGCIDHADIVINNNPPPSIGDFSIDFDSQNRFVTGDIVITDLSISVKTNKAVAACTINVKIGETHVLADYTLAPAVPASQIDVSPLTAVQIQTHQFETDENCSGILGFLVEILVGDTSQLVRDGLAAFLDTPDASGDTPLAGALETALAGINIGGPISDDIGLQLVTAFDAVDEDEAGISFPINITVQAGSETEGPDLFETYRPVESFPGWPPLTPVLGAEYDLALGVSNTAFNQLLKAAVEAGALRADLPAIDLGSGPIEFTAGLLAIFISAFGSLPPETPLSVVIEATLAPIVSGVEDPNREPLELRAPQLLVRIVEPRPGNFTNWLTSAVDFVAGIHPALSEDGTKLVPRLGTLLPEHIRVHVIENAIGANEASFEAFLPDILTLVFPSLSETLTGFPLPDFLDLSLYGVEISQRGSFTALFTKLLPLQLPPQPALVHPSLH